MVNVGDDCEVSIIFEQINDGFLDFNGDFISFSLDNIGLFGIGEYIVILMVNDGVFSSICIVIVMVEDNIVFVVICQDLMIDFIDD